MKLRLWEVEWEEVENPHRFHRRLTSKAGEGVKRVGRKLGLNRGWKARDDATKRNVFRKLKNFPETSEFRVRNIRHATQRD